MLVGQRLQYLAEYVGLIRDTFQMRVSVSAVIVDGIAFEKLCIFNQEFHRRSSLPAQLSAPRAEWKATISARSRPPVSCRVPSLTDTQATLRHIIQLALLIHARSPASTRNSPNIRQLLFRLAEQVRACRCTPASSRHVRCPPAGHACWWSRRARAAGLPSHMAPPHSKFAPHRRKCTAQLSAGPLSPP